jgi:hypothetical protein
MVQYISKDALVAEIKRRMDENRGKQSLPQYFGMIEEDLNILSIIDTIEVKEVNLEKETKKWWKERLHLNPESQLWMDAHQSIVFAKHFFELGLKAAQKGE